MVLVTFVMLMLVFTFFELLGDIIRNSTPLVTVGAYLINLTPSMIYPITPLSVLIAVLVVFGIMNRNSELTAMKATGISLYRIIVPVLAIAAMLSVSSSSSTSSICPRPTAGRRPCATSSKASPPQTFEHPGRKWIFGQQQPGKPSTHLLLRVLRLRHQTPSAISPSSNSIPTPSPSPSASSPPPPIGSRTSHAWVFEDGWERTFNGDEISSYRHFLRQHFP